MSSDQNVRYPGRDLEAMSCAVNYHHWIVDEIGPYLGETTVEVGAGIGSISRLILDKGVRRLIAFEPSTSLFPHLEAELKGDECAVAVNSCFAPEQVPEELDAVVYVNVLEHIEDDRAELVRVLGALRQHGRLCLLVPALKWLYSENDRQVGHIRRYTRRGLREVVESAGFTVLKLTYFDWLGVLPWYVNCVILRHHVDGGSVSAYDRFAVPVTRLIEGAVSPPIGKNLLLIARKE